MIIIIFYWGLIFYFLLLVSIKILASKYTDRFGLLKVFAKTGFAAPILIILMPILSLMIALLNINILLLVRVFFPALYGGILYILLNSLIELALNSVNLNLNVNTIGYITITFWATIYAHTSVFKNLYIKCLELSKYIFKIYLADAIIEKEKVNVSKYLFRFHIYILLAIFYFSVNTLDFADFSSKDHISFITEALLTFVIIDTALTIHKSSFLHN